MVAIGKIAVMLLLYRSGLKRLTDRVDGDPFDDPVLWTELKSSAWAEAQQGAERHATKIRGRWREICICQEIARRIVSMASVLEHAL